MRNVILKSARTIWNQYSLNHLVCIKLSQWTVKPVIKTNILITNDGDDGENNAHE